MYTYTAGSPGTFSGPRPIDIKGPGYGLAPAEEGGVVAEGTSWRQLHKQFSLPPGYSSYLQEGHPLSYAPRFSGGVYSAAGSRGGYRGYGQEAAPAQQSSGSGWADAINALITGTATVFQISQQQKLMKQQQHQAARDAAAAQELARTQALYLQSQSIVPAQGSHVTVAVPPGHAKRGMNTMVMMGGVALLGVGAFFMFGRRRRR